MEKLRVAINAQLSPESEAGGSVTVLRALAALADLDGSEDYVFIGPFDDPDWLRSILPPRQTIIRGPQATANARRDRFEPIKRQLGPLRPFAREVKELIVARRNGPTPRASRASDAAQHSATRTNVKFFRSLGCDVIHFPFQSFEACDVPTVFNPHDLQHLHLAEFFTGQEIARREKLYPAACQTAEAVVVASQFVKRDVVERYGVDAAKVQVIPWAPPPLPRSLERTDESIPAVLRKYGLGDEPFVLYPAMTWEHKNHVRLLEAVASLRDNQRLKCRLVCTGFKTEFWPRIEARLNELGLTELVMFPGLVPVDDLHALYRAAQFVFVPTLFEAASAPVFEAWQLGVPVACAKVTSLPEQVDDAAFLFDPFSVDGIVSALARMSMDLSLREDLKRRGTLRLRDFSLERTAKAYRAVYRQVAGRDLSKEDRLLLDEDRTEYGRKARGAAGE